MPWAYIRTKGKFDELIFEVGFELIYKEECGRGCLIFQRKNISIWNMLNLLFFLFSCIKHIFWYFSCLLVFFKVWQAMTLRLVNHLYHFSLILPHKISPHKKQYKGEVRVSVMKAIGHQKEKQKKYLKKWVLNKI